jgi:hypothetical protein
MIQATRIPWIKDLDKGRLLEQGFAHEFAKHPTGCDNQRLQPRQKER